MPTLKREDGELTLSLSGAEDFQAALDVARGISPRRFDGDRKLWVYPDDAAIAERILLALRPTAESHIVEWVRETRHKRDAELTTALPDDADLLIPWADKLYPFQRAAVNFMAEHPHMLLGDDLGLGKTAQTLAAVNEIGLRDPELDVQRPRLVVCPNSAKGVWAREIEKWLGPDEPYVLVDASTGKKRESQLKEGIASNAWCIVNYEMVRAKKTVTEKQVQHRDGSVGIKAQVTWQAKQPLFEQTDWLAVIADECHRAKNHKSQTAHGLWRCNAPIQIALSGTPLQNHPAELWSLLRWLYPEQYHEQGKRYNGIAWAYWPFYDEYVDDYETSFGRVIVGVKNPDGLRFELKDRLVRRTKKDKLNLPEKVREVVPIKLNPKQQKLYDEAESEFWLTVEQAIKDGDAKLAKEVQAVIEGKKRVIEMSNGAARTVRLRQVASTPALLGAEDDSAKLDAVMDYVLDGPDDKQWVVFTEFVDTANILVKRLRDKKIEAEAFTGEVTDTRLRTEFEDNFQRGEIQVLVGTLGAMRESITLTAADTVIFTERAWTPAWNEQAEDRLYRNGQKNEVTVLILEGIGTVDEDRVKPTNAIKEAIVSSVIKKDRVKVKEQEAVNA